MIQKKLFLLFTMMLLCLSGCTTHFFGDPKFPGGAPACFHKCRNQNMEMATFVYVGEYSTACACHPRTPSATGASQAVGAAESAAAAGVMMQMRREEEQRRRASIQ